MKLKLPYVTVRRNKDKSTRYYFRRRGQPLHVLPDPFDNNFMPEYNRLKEWTAPAVQAEEGSFGWLCDQYMDSAEFKGKAPATRTARKRVILSMMREPIDPKHPETFAMERAHKITSRHVSALRDRKAENPNAANERLKILSQVFKLAIARGWRTDNPVRDVPRLSIPRGGHETATDAHIAQYEAFHTSGPAKRAMVLLKAFGMRISDLRILGPQHIRKGLLTFETVKTGVLCELEVSPEVWQEIEGCRDMVFLTNDNGIAFASDKALSQRVAKWFRQAGVQGVTAHGVRKWLATAMADDGASEYELMAWFGWKDPKEARPYVQTANRRKLAKSAGDRRRSVTSIARDTHIPESVSKNHAKSSG